MAVRKVISEPVEPMQPKSVPPVNTPSAVTQSLPPQPISGMGFGQKLKALLFHPFQFTTYLEQEQGFAHALMMWLEISVLTYLAGAILSVLVLHTLASILSLFVSLFLYPVAIALFGVPTMFLIGLLLHGCLKLFRGQGNFGDTMRAYFYTGVPASLFTVLLSLLFKSQSPSFAHPIVLIFLGFGMFAVYIYSFAIQVWFLSAVHGITKLAAAGATFLASFITGSVAFAIAFIFVLIFGLSFAALLGNSKSQTQYETTVSQIDTQRTNALDAVSNLESKPSTEWTVDEKQQFQQMLLSLDGLHDILSAAKAPDVFSEVHNQLLEALSGYRSANEQFRVALAANDAEALSAAVSTFARADELYVHAFQTYQALVKSQSAATTGASAPQQRLFQGLTPRSI